MFEEDHEEDCDYVIVPLRLGPVNGPKALPTLWELLPGLHNLQHLE